MTVLKTGHSMLGLVTVALFLSAMRVDIRNIIGGTADSALILILPFLVFAAVVTGITSAMTALVLEGLAVIVLVLVIVEEGGNARLYIAGALLLVTFGLSLAQLRLTPPKVD